MGRIVHPSREMASPLWCAALYRRGAHVRAPLRLSRARVVTVTQLSSRTIDRLSLFLALNSEHRSLSSVHDDDAGAFHTMSAHPLCFQPRSSFCADGDALTHVESSESSRLCSRRSVSGLIVCLSSRVSARDSHSIAHNASPPRRRPPDVFSRVQRADTELPLARRRRRTRNRTRRRSPTCELCELTSTSARTMYCTVRYDTRANTRCIRTVQIHDGQKCAVSQNSGLLRWATLRSNRASL